jgi:hypothetical protein
MTGAEHTETPAPDADASASPDAHGPRAAGVALVLLLVGGGLLVLVWVAQGSYAVVETYGGLAGGWAQFLVLHALGAGVVVGVCLFAIARLLERAPRLRWLVLTVVALALLASGLGAHRGSLAHAAASERAEHACDEPVGGVLVAFAEQLEPGPVVIQDGESTRGREDGRCVVLVNVAPDGDVAAAIARVAAANGWSRSPAGWVSPEGVALTHDATSEPEAMTLVELQGYRRDVDRRGGFRGPAAPRAARR